MEYTRKDIAELMEMDDGKVKYYDYSDDESGPTDAVISHPDMMGPWSLSDLDEAPSKKEERKAAELVGMHIHEFRNFVGDMVDEKDEDNE